MTAIDLAQVPVGINTIERLAAYTMSILIRNNPTLKTLEAENDSRFATEGTVFKAADGTQRIVFRLNLPLEPDWNTDTSLPFYQKVSELSNTEVPAEYLQAP